MSRRRSQLAQVQRDALESRRVELAVRFEHFAGSPLPDCILWTGALSREGYPILIRTAGNDTVYAHRWIWEQANGSLADGMSIDHLCSVRCCVSLAHLEAVPVPENTKRAMGRRDTCKYGHPFDAVNKNGHRICRTCRRRHYAECRERKRRRRESGGVFQRANGPTCQRGHPWTPENEERNGEGRRCRTCAQEYRKRKWQMAKAS